jgi:hypothetical protein
MAVLAGVSFLTSSVYRSGLERILARKFDQGIVYGDQDGRSVHRDLPRLRDRKLHISASAFSGIARTRVVNEDLPHHLRGHGHELGAAPIVRLFLLQKAGVGFVHQRGRLERMSGTLISQIAAG